jgi:hypothetical protein
VICCLTRADIDRLRAQYLSPIALTLLVAGG